MVREKKIAIIVRLIGFELGDTIKGKYNFQYPFL